jgi:hypothetical protein
MTTENIGLISSAEYGQKRNREKMDRKVINQRARNLGQAMTE